MDIPSVLAKIAGLILLAWTFKSIYSHVKQLKSENSATSEATASVTEQILNNILLYLWLVFMLVFSTGMIFNN